MKKTLFPQHGYKGKQDYRHQAVSVMLSCNGIVLNYTVVMYDKSQNQKIKKKEPKKKEPAKAVVFE